MPATSPSSGWGAARPHPDAVRYPRTCGFPQQRSLFSPTRQGKGGPAAPNSRILSFSDWQTGIINPQAETTAKTTATTAILRVSFRRRERPGKERPRGAGHGNISRTRDISRTGATGPGGRRDPPSPQGSSIYLPAGGQIPFLKCPAWGGCSPEASRPPSRPCPAHITLAKGHHFGPAPRGKGRSPAKDCAVVGSGTGNGCGSSHDGQLPGEGGQTAGDGG